MSYAFEDLLSVTVTVAAMPDDWSTEPDGDCYTEEDREAFNRGDWSYVGIVATVTIADKLNPGWTCSAESSLWGCDYGSWFAASLDEQDAYLASIGAECVEDALEQLKIDNWAGRHVFRLGDGSLLAEWVRNEARAQVPSRVSA